MRSGLYVVIMLALGFNAGAQDASHKDSLIQQKFTLSNRNDAAESGKYKHLAIAINFDKEHKSYSIAATSEKEINNYLEIKDQDDNVIFFKQVSIHPGSNIIPLDTEDGDQSLFRLSFQDMKNDNPPVFVFRSVKEVVYTRK